MAQGEAPGALTEADIDRALGDLAGRRPVFHAEADLQHALAWELARARPAASIRLERPFRLGGETLHLDFVALESNVSVGVELKHWTRKLVATVDGEEFRLSDGADDAASYDFWKDVSRLERLVSAGVLQRGFVVALTNVPGFWQPRSAGTIFESYRLHEGRTATGSLAWAAHASPGSTGSRSSPIQLAGTYTLQWRNYSRVANHEFRYVVVAV